MSNQMYPFWMKPILPHWLSTLTTACLIGWVVILNVKAYRKRPRFDKSEIIYQEWFASGRSLKNILVRFGGANNCLKLVVTKDFLWITSWFPFSLLGVVYDLEHVIPIGSIKEFQYINRFLRQKTINLTYVDSEYQQHSVELIPKRREEFFRVIEELRKHT